MSATFLLETRKDPLNAVRGFLGDLWVRADLEGMLVPAACESDPVAAPRLLDDPDQLVMANPFVPLTPVNAARLVEAIDRQRPGARLGAVLRSCEVRALGAPPTWLVVSVDCLGTFAVDDFSWRLEKAGTLEELTMQALQNARQGGVAMHRFRSACQICSEPGAQEMDISLHVIGLSVREHVLVRARDEEMARRLSLEKLTNGLAPEWLVEQHERVASHARERRLRSRRRAFAELAPEFPHTLTSFQEHLQGCQPCQACMEVCPHFTGEWSVDCSSGVDVLDCMRSWLAACAGCGMCEQACPQKLPLAAVIGRLSYEINRDGTAAPAAR